MDIIIDIMFDQDETDEDEDYADYPMPRSISQRSDHFVVQVVDNMISREFKIHFRMTKHTFETILHLVEGELLKKNAYGRSTISPRTQLLATLWLLATPDSYRSVGLMFDMGKSSLSVSFFRVVKALNAIAPDVIKWPDAIERAGSAQAFLKMAQIPGVIGAVDGTYVPIKAPKIDPQSYINRKCFYGFTLQAICDERLRYIDAFTGYPSSVSDIRIFKNSDIYASIATNATLYFSPNERILGDKAYPVLSWCIPPYIKHNRLTAVQTNFNKRHSSTRQVVERSFALLFGRFRRLKYLDMNRNDMIPATIIAACVLHNICLLEPDDLSATFEREGNAFLRNRGNEDEDRELHSIPENGHSIRDEIAAALPTE